MSPDFELIRRAYAAFNERDLDGALAAMHPDVRWPSVAQGTVLVDQHVEHVYTLRDGLIAQMDVRGGGSQVRLARMTSLAAEVP